MIDMTDAPTFGQRVDGCPYVVRPSAYALVRNDAGELATFRTPKGYVLPGGGIDAGETPEEAAIREAAEEGGLVIDVRAEVGRAIEIVYSVDEETCFEKRSIFFEACLVGTVQPAEDDHELLWLSPDRACELLRHPSHRWGVERLSGAGEG